MLYVDDAHCAWCVRCNSVRDMILATAAWNTLIGAQMSEVDVSLTDEVTSAFIQNAVSQYSELNISIMHSEGGRTFPMLVSQAMIDEAVRMRTREAKSYRQIARVMGVTPSIVYNMLKHGLGQNAVESPEELRKMELEKFDSMEQAVLDVLWVDQAASEESATARGRVLAAINSLVKISESRRKLLGLDAPTIVETKPIEVKLNGIDVNDL